MFILKKDNIFKLVLFSYGMGKGLGVILLVIGLFILYMRIDGRLEFFDIYSIYGVNYAFIIGAIFSIVGLGMLITSRPKYPRY